MAFFFTPLLPPLEEDDDCGDPPVMRFRLETAPNDIPRFQSDTCSRRRMSHGTSAGRDSLMTTRDTSQCPQTHGNGEGHRDYGSDNDNAGLSSPMTPPQKRPKSPATEGSMMSIHLPDVDKSVLNSINELELDIPACKWLPVGGGC
eukprot:GHVU01179306.1.p1 GENE.GHVU01179306.1~~GHVU01179306.1.p1  ORF type:complete len:146 (+),score=16.16 GHVU01179306.1:282-719(+)